MLTFVGVATLDALALVDRYPAADERVEASALSYAGGGPAATAAVTAARQGHDVAFIGAVGDDPEGHQILAGLEAEGIHTDGVVVLPGRLSGASVVVVAAESATRAICNRPLPVADLAAQQAALELIAGSSWVHADHIGWAPVQAAIRRLGRAPMLSYDGGHQVAGFTAAGLDLYVPTVETLLARFGPADVPILLAQARAEGSRTVVATQGEAGSWVLSELGEPSQVSAFHVEVVSTLGAGDVFHGALVASLAGGYPLIESVRRANATAALSCRGLDGRSAIPTPSELDAFLATYESAPTVSVNLDQE